MAGSLMRWGEVAWGSVDRHNLLPRRHLVVLPDGPSTRIDEAFTLASGRYRRTYVPASTPGARPFLRVDNVRSLLPSASDDDLVWVLPPPTTANVTVRTGDVVTSRTASLGRAFVVPPSLDGAVMSQHLTRLRLREGLEGHVNPWLVATWLSSRAGRDALIARASGSTRMELNHRDLGGIRIPVRPSSRRADVDPGVLHDAVLALERTTRRRVDAALALPTDRTPSPWFTVEADAVDERSFLPRYHTPAARALEAHLREHYTTVPLADVARVFRGRGTRALEYTTHGIPYVRPGELVNGGVAPQPTHHASEQTWRAHGQYVGAGDILVSIEGKLGATALLGEDERCVVKNHVAIVRTHPEAPVDAAWVWAVLRARVGSAQLDRFRVIQATIPGLGRSIGELLVPIAPRDPANRPAFAALAASITADTSALLDKRRQLHAQLAAWREQLGSPTSPRPPESPGGDPRSDG